MTQSSHTFLRLIGCALLALPTFVFAQFDDEEEDAGKELTYSYFDLWVGQGEFGESPNEVDYEGFSFDWAHDFEDSPMFTWLSYDSYDAEADDGSNITGADIDFFTLGLGIHRPTPFAKSLHLSWYLGASYELGQFDSASTGDNKRSSGAGAHAGLTGILFTEKLGWHARIRYFDADGSDVIYRAGVNYALNDRYALHAEYLTFGDAEITGFRAGIRFILGVSEDDDW